MAIDTERNRVLASLRDQAEGVDSCVLGEHLTLAREVVEHHLLYRVDYDLAKWRRVRSGDHLHDSYDSLDIVINSQTPYGEAVVGAMHLSVRLYEKVSTILVR